MKFYMTRYLIGRFPKLSRIFRGYETWMIFDIPIILGGFALALIFRSFTANVDFGSGLLFSLIIVLTFLLANWLFGIYRRYWSYAVAHDAIALGMASGLATIAVLLADILFQPHPVPVSVVLVGGFFALVGQLLIRYRRRIFSGTRWALRNSLYRVLGQGTRTLIIGAGELGQALAFQMTMTPAGRSHYLIGFLDDDAAKIGKIIHGLPVCGSCDQVTQLVPQHKVALIIIALNNVGKERLQKLIDQCIDTDAQVRLLPDMFSMLNGSANPVPLREITVNDLLGRPSHKTAPALSDSFLTGGRILITGACGSIGSELARQILDARPARLMLLDNNESGIHDLVMDLRNHLVALGQPDCLVPIIGDVTLQPQLEHIFACERPEVVFHAAAYKHVHWMELQPLQAMRVNILGTRNVLDACHRYGSKRFTLISTDKAAASCSIMGATKRVCELLVLNGNGTTQGAVHGPSPTATGAKSAPGCLCTVVRFGNVLGSRGSVVPTFERQIAHGGPVTVTDPDMRRYFMTIQEAVSLVLEATAITEGNDLFMLDMGEDISILDLARRMIRLRGLRPHVDVPIVYTGIRPGERIREQLLNATETRVATGQPGVFRLRSSTNTNTINPPLHLAQLEAYVSAYDNEAAVRWLSTLVPQITAATSPERETGL